MDTKRFAISYGGLVWLATLSGVGPRSSGVEVDPDRIRVRMGSFRLDIPRSSVRSVNRDVGPVGGTRGVHGFAGRWLVNGSASGLVKLTIRPPGRTERGLSTFFARVKVHSLTLSLVDPDGFIDAIEPPARGG